MLGHIRKLSEKVDTKKRVLNTVSKAVWITYKL